MTEDKDLKNENRLTKMEERLKNIEEQIKALPELIVKGVMMQVEIIKNEAVEQYRREAESKYALKADIRLISDEKSFETRVCDIISKQVGKWFITKVVVSTGIIIAIFQFIVERYK